MDSSTVTVLVVIVFAIIAIFSFVVYQQRGETEIKILGISLKIKGSNDKPEPKPAISAKDVISREGGLLARDDTGLGIEIEKVDVKDDVLLSSTPPAERNEKNNTSINPTTLTAESLSAGGNITIQQFVGSQVPLSQQIEFFIKQIGLEDTRKRNYSNSQFESYSNVWKSLQSLRLAGDDLWISANDKNLFTFIEQLRKTSNLVKENGIFFDDQDYHELKIILERFGDYRIGKMRLIEIRTSFLPDPRRESRNFQEALKYLVRHFNDPEVQEQIEENRKYKSEYEKLLEKIRISFRKRLSNSP